MKHSRFGLLLLSAAGVWACNADPTESLRETGTRIIADPTVIYLDKGASTSLTVQRVDEQGSQLASTFTATSDNPNVTVVVDTTYLVTTNGSKIQTSERFTVAGSDYVLTAVHVQAGSDTLTVPVSVVPKTTIAATFSNLTPALGEAVTVTAPPGISFDPASTVSFGPAPILPPADVVVATDGLSISFVPPPNLTTAPAIITDVHSVGSPDLTFTNNTTEGITTPAVTTLPGTFSTLTPAGNEVVTLTLTAATGAPGATMDVGGTAGTVLDRPTANTIRLLPAPGSVGLVTLTNGVVLDALPQFALTLTNADTMTVGATVAPLAGTAAAATAPTIGTPANVGDAASTYDSPDFTGSADHFYKVVIPADGDYDFTLDWTVGSDLDMFVCPSPGAIDDTCNFDAATGNQPEATTITLTAGTYWVVAEDFGGDAAGSVIHVTVARGS